MWQFVDSIGPGVPLFTALFILMREYKINVTVYI